MVKVMLLIWLQYLKEDTREVLYNYVFNIIKFLRVYTDCCKSGLL